MHNSRNHEPANQQHEARLWCAAAASSKSGVSPSRPRSAHAGELGTWWRVGARSKKSDTIDQINKGENGFLVGNLYPFCFNLSDGIIVALGNPNVKQLVGTDSRLLKASW